MKLLKKIEHYLILGSFMLAVGCAQQGAPTGGPEDEDPPVVLKADPENYSTMFKSKKILITFDEYLDMGNFTQELIVSPPMEEKPLVKLRNKTLIIEFEEELKEDVTYTFNFGEGIKDLNEKNVLLNYEYVFATGKRLDSLSIKGTLKNAFDLSIPETPIFVMLYTELADSLPLSEIPIYVGRTDKNGNFAVNNLRSGIYKLFVLKDGNNNFLFDLPTETISFLDTSVFVDAEYYRKLLLETGVYDSSDLFADTIALTIDTTGMTVDSIAMILDSLENNKPDFNSIFIDMYMFKEDPINQYISEYKREKRRVLTLAFNLPLTDSFSYKPFFPEMLGPEAFIPEFGRKRDSLTLWLADTLIASIDTIGLAVEYTALDSLGMPVSVIDSLLFTFREKTVKKKTGKKAEPTKESMKINTIANSGKQHILKDLVFTVEYPIASIDPDLFALYIIPDSTEIPVKVSPILDPEQIHRVRIKHEWEEEGKYRVVVYPGAIKDVYGIVNDTIDKTFNIRPLAEYGKINLSLENVEDPIMIEIYKKEAIVRKMPVSSSGTYVFDFLNPDTYRIKFVHDRNENGKWDTGKYLEHRQPERVEFLPRDLKIRANWDHDIKYSIGSNDAPPLAPDENAVEESIL